MKKVLIVDDNSANRYLLKSLLEEGFEVTEAENGKEALDKAYADPPDLIVSDILMPVMDGYALCRQWKSDDQLKHIPLVFYTATYTEHRDEVFALKLGADRFVLKPQDPDLLMNILKEVLEEDHVVKQATSKPFGEEMELFRQYNEILFRKLEKKMLDLQEAERRYRSAFENAIGGIVQTSPDGLLLNLNPAMARMLGFESPEQAMKEIGKVADHFYENPKDRERLKQLLESEGVVRNYEMHLRHLAGHTIIARMNAHTVRDKAGCTLYYQGEMEDITERKAAEAALLASEEKYRSIFETALEGLFRATLDGRIIAVNPAMARIYHFESPEQMIAEVHDIGAQLYANREDRKTYASLLRKKGIVQNFETEQRRRDGSTVWVSANAIPVRDENRKIVYYQGMVEDVTKRKLADEAKKESERQYRELYDFLPIPAYEMDLGGNATFVNRAIHEVFGVTEEDVKKGLNARQLLSAEGVEELRKDIESLLRGGQVGGKEYTLRRLDGSFFPAIVNSSIIYRKGEPVGVRGAVIDITDRKRVEDELRRSEEKYRVLIDNANEAILIIQDGLLKFANPASLIFSGYSKEALLFKPFTEFVYPEDREMMKEYYIKRISGEDVPTNYDFRIKTQDGSVKWMTVHTALVEWEGSSATLNFLSDITNQKKAEDALRESEERYRSLFEYLQDAVFLTKPDGSIIEANQAACAMFGRSVDEFRAVGRSGLVDAADARLKAALEERARTGKARADLTMIRANGEKFLADVTSTVFTDIHGQQKTSMIIRDITERKKAEEALLESEKRYRSVFEDHVAVKLLIDPDDGSIIEANAAAENYYGWSREQLKKMKIQDINVLPPEDVRKETENAIAEKQVHFEFRHRRADGSVRDVEVLTSKIDMRGKALLHSIVHDITERNEAEDALRNAEARYRSYFELPLIGIAIISPEKSWLEANDRLLAILGYPWQELKKMTWSDLTYPEDLAADAEQFNRVLAGKIESYMLEKRFIQKNGEVIWISLAVGCVRNQHGAVDYFVALLDDITDRKESVKRIRKSLEATIQAMTVAVETRDPYTAGHQRRVADLARSIAAEMGFAADQIDGVRMAAVIHDIGKLSVPAEFLSMPRRLTDMEYSIIKTHAQAGHVILKDIEFPWPIARMVLEHHERMDGSGYPQGLTRNDILIESRILAVADVLEAMASHRPYRPGLGLDAALREISENSGILYDPEVVDACLRLFHDKGYGIVD